MSLIQKVNGSTKRQAGQKKDLTAGLRTAAATLAVNAIEQFAGFRFDPAPNYLFFVELSGVIVAYFTQLNGLTLSRETEPVREGGINSHITHLPGRLTQSNLTLSRGMSINRQLWDWFMKGQYDMHVKRINMSIIQAAPGHNLISMVGLGDVLPRGAGYGKVRHWDLVDAFPVKYLIGDLNTSTVDQAVIETVEIAHRGISLSYEVLTPVNPLATALAVAPEVARVAGANMAGVNTARSVLPR